MCVCVCLPKRKRSFLWSNQQIWQAVYLIDGCLKTFVFDKFNSFTLHSTAIYETEFFKKKMSKFSEVVKHLHIFGYFSTWCVCVCVRHTYGEPSYSQFWNVNRIIKISSNSSGVFLSLSLCGPFFQKCNFTSSKFLWTQQHCRNRRVKSRKKHVTQVNFFSIFFAWNHIFLFIVQ